MSKLRVTSGDTYILNLFFLGIDEVKSLFNACNPSIINISLSSKTTGSLTYSFLPNIKLYVGNFTFSPFNNLVKSLLNNSTSTAFIFSKS